MTAMLALSSVVPALLLMWCFWARDVYREPPPVVWSTFALGVFSVVPVLLVAAILTASAAITAETGGTLVFLGVSILTVFLGVRLFRKGIARLNREPHVLMARSAALKRLS